MFARYASPVRISVAAACWCLLVVLAFSDTWDPVPSLPFGVWLTLCVTATLGAGLVARSAWILLVVPAPSIAAGVLGWATRNGSGDGVAMVPAVASVLAVLLLLAGALVGRWLPRVSRAGALLLAIPVVPILWALWLQWRPVDATPRQTIVVGLHPASVGELALGAPLVRAEQLIGAPFQVPPREGRLLCAPEAVLEGFSFPVVAKRACHGKVAALEIEGRTVMLMTTDARAQTRRGVGIGDDIRIAKRRYPNLACWRDDMGNPECGGLTPGGVSVVFHGDPIDALALSRGIDVIGRLPRL